jgi:hypothetical protein
MNLEIGILIPTTQINLNYNKNKNPPGGRFLFPGSLLQGYSYDKIMIIFNRAATSWQWGEDNIICISELHD